MINIAVNKGAHSDYPDRTRIASALLTGIYIADINGTPSEQVYRTSIAVTQILGSYIAANINRASGK